MSQVNDYLKHAENARQQAEQSSRPEDIAMWLRIAEQWMRLASDAFLMSSLLSIRIALPRSFQVGADEVV